MNNAFFIHWHPDPYVFNVGVLSLRWYGLVFALAFACGFYLFKSMAKREGIDVKNLDYLLYLGLVLSLLFSRLFHVFFYDWSYYKYHLNEIPLIWEGGLASHGGGIGLIAAVLIWCKYFAKANPVKVIDLMTPAAFMGGGFIRIGNFFNSEILGKVTDVPWAVVFDLRDSFPRHPAQMYEAITCFVGTGILYFAYKKGASKFGGLLTGMFLFLAFMPRIFIEMFKENQEKYDTGLILNTGQLLSLPYVLIGLSIILFALRKKLLPKL